MSSANRTYRVWAQTSPSSYFLVTPYIFSSETKAALFNTYYIATLPYIMMVEVYIPIVK